MKFSAVEKECLANKLGVKEFLSVLTKIPFCSTERSSCFGMVESFEVRQRSFYKMESLTYNHISSPFVIDQENKM